MTWTADFAWFQVNATGLLAAGFSGAIRYCVPGNDKSITPPEFHNLTATPGMALALVNETFGQAASRGYNQGRQEAIAAFGYADQLGWPHDRPVYFVGEDPTSIPPPWPLIEDYFRGVATVVPVARVGYYGSARCAEHMLDLGLVTWAWEVQTWPGAPSPRAHLTQMYYPEAGAPGNFGGQVDVNKVHQADWGQWSAVTPTPSSTGDADMTPDQAAKLDAIYEAAFATDAATDDNGRPIPDHWGIGAALNHARAVDRKVDALAAKVDQLAGVVAKLGQSAPSAPTVDVEQLAGAILRQLAAPKP